MRLDYFVFGYVRIKISANDVLKAVKILKKGGVSVRINSRGEFCASVFKVRRICNLLNARVEYSKSEILGMGGFVYKNRGRYGAIAAVLAVIAIWAVSSLYVWDIRIEGLSFEGCEVVEAELAECGFFVGAPWRKVDKSVVERALLEKSDTVSWVNINRRGSVAYVKVLEKNYHENEPQVKGYSSVVSAYDGVVEEITVKKGVAAVKVGDSVKKGDLLISGILPSDLGGGFCHADGCVYLRVSEEISVSVDSFKEEKTLTESKICGFSIKILNFCAKIFSNRRNLDATCVIIEETKEIKVAEKKIPISFLIERKERYTVEKTPLSAEQMTAEATAIMLGELNRSLSDATLLRIKTTGEFVDGKYTMTVSIVALRNATVDLAFSKT